MDEELLPPPPPELQSQFDATSTLGRRKLPPIAPKPNLSRLPNSPKFKAAGYGTLPNPNKKSGKNVGGGMGDMKLSRSGRRISFDDNIQLIDDGQPAAVPAPLPPGFIHGLEQERFFINSQKLWEICRVGPDSAFSSLTGYRIIITKKSRGITFIKLIQMSNAVFFEI